MGYFSVCVCSLEYYRRKVHEKSDDFDQLKLRAGFGIVGNQNIDDFAYLSLYNVSYTGTSDTGYTNSFVSNGRRGTPDISWEKQKQWNLGVDMAFLQNRVRLSVDAFLIKIRIC